MSFINDSDSGLYSISNNVLGFATATTERMRINLNGQTLHSDGLFLTPSMSFINDPDTGFYSPAANVLGIATQGTERMRVDATGLVAINTTTATIGAALDIRGSGTASSSVLVPRDTTANRPTVGANGMIRYNTNLAKLEAYGNSRWDTVAKGPIYKFKAADQTCTLDATVNNDNDYFFEAAPNTVYFVEISGGIDCTNGGGACTTADFRYSFTLPSGTMNVGVYISGQTTNGHIDGVSGTENPNAANVAASVGQTLWVRGYFNIGATGGTVTFRWSEFVSNAATVTVKANGILVATPLN